MPDTAAGPALRAALSPAMARRSLVLAVVVGTVLNAINQGDVLLAGGTVNWLKVGLTYVVPFCVSTYGAFCACRMSTGPVGRA